MTKEKSFFEKLNDPQLIKKLRLLAIALVIILFMAKFVMTGFLVLATICLSLFTSLFGLKWTGVELVTLSTIVFGMVYGPKVGAIMGFVLIILQLISGQFLNLYIVWVIPGYVIAGALAGMIGGTNITTVGFGILVGLDIVFTLFTAVFTPPALAHFIPYMIGNLIFNFIIFTTIAPMILGVLI